MSKLFLLLQLLPSHNSLIACQDWEVARRITCSPARHTEHAPQNPMHSRSLGQATTSAGLVIHVQPGCCLTFMLRLPLNILMAAARSIGHDPRDSVNMKENLSTKLSTLSHPICWSSLPARTA